MADGWYATPRNSLLGAASDGLRRAREVMDNVPLPQFLGGGLGQLMIGKAPEEVNEWSYGNAPFQTTQEGVRLPQIKQGRGQGVVDTAFLPVAETIGAGKLAGAGLRGAYNRVIGDSAAELGRREFLEKAGALGAAGAAMSALPPGTKTVAKLLDTPAASAAAKVGKAALRPSPYNFFRAENLILQKYNKGLDDLLDPLFREERRMESLIDGGADVDYKLIENLNTERKAIQERMRKTRDAELEQLVREHGGKHKPMTVMEDEYTQRMMDATSQAERDLIHKQYQEQYRKYGWLPNDEVEALVRKNELYTDPFTGMGARLDKHGNLEWVSPRTGSAARYQHWVHDDYSFPDIGNELGELPAGKQWPTEPPWTLGSSHWTPE